MKVLWQRQDMLPESKVGSLPTLARTGIAMSLPVRLQVKGHSQAGTRLLPNQPITSLQALLPALCYDLLHLQEGEQGGSQPKKDRQL